MQTRRKEPCCCFPKLELATQLLARYRVLLCIINSQYATGQGLKVWFIFQTGTSSDGTSRQKLMEIQIKSTFVFMFHWNKFYIRNNFNFSIPLKRPFPWTSYNFTFALDWAFASKLANHTVNTNWLIGFGLASWKMIHTTKSKSPFRVNCTIVNFQFKSEKANRSVSFIWLW